jgi:protein O-GlcNAc transferase
MMAPMASLSEALAAAIAHHQAGRLSEAEQVYREILQLEPGHAESWHSLGMIAYQMGNRNVAAEHIQRALTLRPDYAEAYSNLGSILKEARRLEEAIGCFQRAVEFAPGIAEFHYNLGSALHEHGQTQQAIASYCRAVQLKPALVQAQFQLGVCLQRLGQLDQAAACYCQVLSLRPDIPEAHNNLAAILLHQAKWVEADFHFSRAIGLNPNYAVAWNNRGNVLKKLERIDEARQCYLRAIDLQPDYAAARSNLGVVSLGEGKLDEAINLFHETLKIDWAVSEAHCNLGNALKNVGQIDSAISSYRKALELRPDYELAHSNLAYSLTFCEGYDAAAIYDEARRFDAQHTAPLAQFIQPHANERSPNRRLRIGYVSPDFRNHCQAFFTLPLLSAHDHERFEIFCYADVVLRDPITERLRGLSDVWRDIQGWTAEKTAEVIRQDQIDILVDLTMHMEGAHPFVFARKPAPVQVCWLAYPGTTGLTAIDYRLTDAYLDPPGMFDPFYSEESIRLADTFWCYDPLASEPAVSPLPALTNGHVTFGCLNNFCKVNATTLRLWAGVLKAVSGSRLILLAPEGSARQWVLRVLGEEGVNAERIAFVPRQGRLQYLETYCRIDIGLDTLPYNGHTTSLDAFWMGVPVVTLVGQTVVGRAGLSQLTNLGLPELIAKKREKYVEIVADLAADLPRLSQLRAGLRQRMRQSPLMDGPRFARNVEAAYRQMWRRWCADGP